MHATEAMIKHLAFVDRRSPEDERLEDEDTARLVVRIQAGAGEEFATLYRRYFDRVYSYLRVALKDVHEAEDVTQQAFTQVLEALPRYERRSQRFDAWLFTIVRNLAISHLRAQRRVEPVDPAELSVRGEEAAAAEPAEIELPALGWVKDNELLLLIERLPLVQRQVLIMRFLFDMRPREIAEVLEMKPNHVSVLLYRALGFLRRRLDALGREPKSDDRARWQRVPVQARVLRNRRFSLWR